jgi:hypothetical protein
MADDDARGSGADAKRQKKNAMVLAQMPSWPGARVESREVARTTHQVLGRIAVAAVKSRPALRRAVPCMRVVTFWGRGPSPIDEIREQFGQGMDIEEVATFPLVSETTMASYMTRRDSTRPRERHHSISNNMSGEGDDIWTVSARTHW